MIEIWRRVQFLLQRGRMQRELEEEMAAHRAEMADPAAFGSGLKLREEASDVWGFGWLDRLGQDLRYAVRILRNSPGFTLTATAVLAFGIGLNVTAFGFLNTAMFRPLPGIEEPHTLMRLTRRSIESSSSNLSYPSFDFYRRNNDVFASMFAIAGGELTFGENERWRAKLITPDFFAELGAGPAYGRLETVEQGDVILSAAFFERRFASDVSMLGKPILLNRKAARITGVVSARFQGLDPEGADVWARIEDHPHFYAGSKVLTSVEQQPMQLYGRLAPGSTPKAAEEAMRPLVDARREVSPQEIWKGEYLHVEPGAYILQGSEKLTKPLLFAETLLLLVLATACANLGNLLLARGLSRERELSIRAAVGANRARLVRQLMTESLLLALLGAAAGLVLSTLATKLMVRALDWPAFIDAAPDWRVAAFAIGTALLATLFFGLAPALQATGNRVRRAHRLRLTLVATQAAASCVLLIVSGLLTRGLQRAVNSSPGFEFEQSAVVDPNLSDVGREGTAARFYFDDLRARLARLNGVEATALATIPPLGQRSATTLLPAGMVLVNQIDGGYFDAMRIPLLRGRTVRAGEREVAIVSERLAARMWPGEDPVGKPYLSRDGKDFGRPIWTVVGVAGNAPVYDPGDSDAMELYFPIADADMARAVLLVRTAKLAAMQKDLQQAANEVDSRVIPRVTPLREGMDRLLRNSRSGAMAVSLLGAVSLCLAVVGFSGLIWFAVTQRTREIGVRLALGATRWEVIRIGLDRLLAPAVIGLAAGVLVAGGLAGLLRSQLYGLSTLDPVSFAAAPVLFVFCALVFSVGPLSRAARVDPAAALRHD